MHSDIASMSDRMFDKRILFIGDHSHWSKKAAGHLQSHFRCVTTLYWENGEPYPSQIVSWSGDLILSFKSDLVLSKEILANSSEYALNFHPAPPHYRGIGGYNYALFHRDEIYGATCHYMVEKIDFGKIIKVVRFPLNGSEKASSLKMKTGSYCLALFYEIAELIMTGSPLPSSQERWGERLYTRKGLVEFIRQVSRQTPACNCIS